MTVKYFTNNFLHTYMPWSRKKSTPNVSYRKGSIGRIIKEFSDDLEKSNFDKQTILAISNSLQKNYTFNKEYVDLLLATLKHKYKDHQEIQGISLPT